MAGRFTPLGEFWPLDQAGSNRVVYEVGSWTFKCGYSEKENSFVLGF